MPGSEAYTGNSGEPLKVPQQGSSCTLHGAPRGSLWRLQKRIRLTWGGGSGGVDVQRNNKKVA